MSIDYEKLRERYTESRDKQLSSNHGLRLDVEAYCHAFGQEVYGIKMNGGSTLYLLRECIFDPNHKNGEAAIGQADDGKLFYQCFHDSCQGHTWKEAREVISGKDNLSRFMGSASGGEVSSMTGDLISIKPLVVIGVQEFIGLDLPPRSNILSPWLPEQGLAMIHAPRGVGKTHLALLVAYIVACGGKSFNGWHAPESKAVLFIDGEMPAAVLQERLSGIILGTGIEPQAPLNILTPDLQTNGMPDLGTKKGQDAVETHIEQSDLVIIDNLSALVRSGKENEAEGWLPVQEWALRLRSKGKSILFIHHSGKGGQQRGTSKREDVLDTVIGLKHPSDYSPEQGCRFELHFEKARGIAGSDVKPLELQMTSVNGMTTWAYRTIDVTRHEKILELKELGLRPAEIAKELGINRSTVTRHLKVGGGQ